MENFYVTYDATDPQQLKVGLSAVEADPTSTALFIAAVILAGSLLSLFIGVGICICVR